MYFVTSAYAALTFAATVLKVFRVVISDADSVWELLSLRYAK